RAADRAGHARRPAPAGRQERHKPRGHVPCARRAAGAGGVSSPGTLTWFAHHEFRLAWRDWLHMVTAGRRRRERTVAIALMLVILFMHFVAHSMVGRFAHVGVDADKSALLAIAVSLLLSWSLLLSQAMESATRAFYARSDLDLILSSPAAA